MRKRPLMQLNANLELHDGDGCFTVKRRYSSDGKPRELFSAKTIPELMARLDDHDVRLDKVIALKLHLLPVSYAAWSKTGMLDHDG